MPQIIRYIDAIAREKKRDVLLIQFGPEGPLMSLDDSEPDRLSYEYDEDPWRQEVIRWLDQQGIPWEKCAPFVTCSCSLGYMGDIYVDVPYDEQNSVYQMLRDYLENPDGSMRDEEHVRFYLLPLEWAMKNANQNEPGFWDDAF